MSEGCDYLVCATPRSGSTLLCAALAATGVAGRPEEFFEARRDSGIPRRPREYFDDAPPELRARVPDVDPPAPAYSDLRDVRDWRAHLARARSAGTTPNGVFGAKLMWMHTADLVALAGGPDLATVLDELFGGAAYVWVRRDDRVRQAVSLWRAMQSQAWRSGDAQAVEDRPLRYDYAAIDHLVAFLERDDAAWEEHFAAHGIAPLTLTYEQIAADPGAGAQEVLAFLGVDRRVSPNGHRLSRQADALSEDWTRRYREEAVA